MDARPILIVRTEQVFKEIFAIDQRLRQLGVEAESLLEETKEMYNQYGEKRSTELKHFESIAKKAKMGVLVAGEDKDKYTNFKRCRYWNKGYCREGTPKCPYYHPPDDCQQHLQKGRCSSQGCPLRHRKKCKYWETKAGCFRQGRCQYLHLENTDKVHNHECIEVETNLIEESNSCEPIEKYKDSLKDAQKDTSRATISDEATSKNVEKENREMIETNNMKLSCDLCKYRCKDKIILTNHMDSKHDGYKECYMCEHNFLCATTLKIHQDTVHTDDEMFAALERICENATGNMKM